MAAALACVSLVEVLLAAWSLALTEGFGCGDTDPGCDPSRPLDERLLISTVILVAASLTARASWLWLAAARARRAPTRAYGPTLVAAAATATAFAILLAING